MTSCRAIPTATALLYSLSLAGEPDCEKLRRTAKQHDSVIMADSTLQIRVECPTHGWETDQGNRTMRCSIARDERRTAMTCETTYIPPLQYRSVDGKAHGSSEYDLEGNLVVWVPFASSMLRNNEINDTFEESVSFGINPGGAIVRQGSSISLSRHKPSDENTAKNNQLAQYFWALGRNFSALLECVGNPERVDVDFPVIRVPGPCWGTLFGDWVLAFELDSQALVRSATFTKAGSMEPTIECRSEGTACFGEIAFAQSGWCSVNLGGGTMVVTKVYIEGFENRANEVLIKRVEERLHRVDEREHYLHDYRSDANHPSYMHVPARARERSPNE
jgi:hypothetical protein